MGDLRPAEASGGEHRRRHGPVPRQSRRALRRRSAPGRRIERALGRRRGSRAGRRRRGRRGRRSRLLSGSRRPAAEHSVGASNRRSTAVSISCGSVTAICHSGPAQPIWLTMAVFLPLKGKAARWSRPAASSRRAVRVNWRAAAFGATCQATSPRARGANPVPVNTQAIGKTYEPTLYAVGREKIKEYARRWARPTRPPRRGGGPRGRLCGCCGAADVRRRLQRPSVGPPIFDPEIELNFAMMVHGGQEFEWGPLVVAGDEITTVASVKDISESDGRGYYVFESDLDEPARRAGVSRHLDEHRARSVIALMSRSDSGSTDSRGEGHAGQVPHRPLRGRLRRLQPDPHRRGLRQSGRPARADPARAVDDGPGRARPDRGGGRPRASEAPVGAVPRHGRARAGGRGEGHCARGRATAA